MFTVPVGMPFWGVGDNETLIVALFLPIVKLGYWVLPCTGKCIELEYEMVRSLDR